MEKEMEKKNKSMQASKKINEKNDADNTAYHYDSVQ